MAALPWPSVFLIPRASMPMLPPTGRSPNATLPASSAAPTILLSLSIGLTAPPIIYSCAGKPMPPSPRWPPTISVSLPPTPCWLSRPSIWHTCRPPLEQKRKPWSSTSSFAPSSVPGTAGGRREPSSTSPAVPILAQRS